MILTQKLSSFFSYLNEEQYFKIKKKKSQAAHFYCVPQLIRCLFDSRELFMQNVLMEWHETSTILA